MWSKKRKINWYKIRHFKSGLIKLEKDLDAILRGYIFQSALIFVKLDSKIDWDKTILRVHRWWYFNLICAAIFIYLFCNYWIRWTCVIIPNSGIVLARKKKNETKCSVKINSQYSWLCSKNEKNDVIYSPSRRHSGTIWLKAGVILWSQACAHGPSPKFAPSPRS